jgi:hydroxymethylbilane synthase
VSSARSPRRLRLATRGSPLARKQAEIVGELLADATGGDVVAELVVVVTHGDRAQDVPLHQVGGQGIFVKEVERAVLEGEADAAVHSAKDLPASETLLPLIAVPPRADPRDALVGCRLGELRPGAHVATGSVRRRAQLAWLRPALTFVELRGNIGTRLSKVPPGGAIVMAAAALERLGLSDSAAEVLSPLTMLPQVGQGAIAVCARPDDAEVSQVLATIDHEPSRRAIEAERAYLAGVGGGCELPVGAYAELGEDGQITLDAMIASFDGHIMVRESLTGAEPLAVGAALAELVLDGSGGRTLLEAAGR